MKAFFSFLIAVLFICASGTDLWANGVNEAGEKLSEGDYDAAIAIYAAEIAETPQDGRLHVALGETYIARGDELADDGDAEAANGSYDLAITSFTSAITLMANPSTAYRGRGVARQQKGDHDGAVADLTLALGQSDRYADAYYHRGVSYKALGENALAQEDYNTLKEISARRAAELAQILGL